MRSSDKINNAFLSLLDRPFRCRRVVFAREAGPVIRQDMRRESSGMLAFLLGGSQKTGFYRNKTIVNHILREGEVFFAPVGHPYLIDWQADCRRIGIVAGEFGRLSISWNNHVTGRSRIVDYPDLWYSAGVREEIDLFALFTALTGRIDKPEDSGVTCALAELIIRRVAEHLETEWVESPKRSARATFQRICGYLEAHSREPVSRKEVALKFGLHPDYVTRVFKQYAQSGFSEYLLGVRMMSAEWYLKNSDLSVRETAETCGFSDAGYFIKVFRGRHGVAPGEFRKHYRTNAPIISAKENIS